VGGESVKTVDRVIIDLSAEPIEVIKSYALMGDPEAVRLWLDADAGTERHLAGQHDQKTHGSYGIAHRPAEAGFSPPDGERHLAGQHPQKSHGGGGTGGWTVQTAEDLDNENVAQVEKEIGRSLTPEERKAWLASTSNNVRKQLVKGDITVTDVSGISDADLQSIATTVDRLNANYPPAKGKRVWVTVNDPAVFRKPDPKFGPDAYVGATTQLGTGRITLNRRTVDDKDKPYGSGDLAELKYADRVSGALVHEWGHVTDGASDSQAYLSWAKYGFGVSDYGMESPREAKAEGFTAWVMSAGHTTNDAAQQYAAEYGWKVIK
jgi:hypothetical protein